MEKLFGTDGIRGITGHNPITPEIGASLGRAAVRLCIRQKRRPVVLVGRDTRASGEMLEKAVLSGVVSAGGKAISVGVLPTPGVAFHIKKSDARIGITITASHNSYEYNGFKVFSRDGYKLTDEEELEIEEFISTKDSPVAGEHIIKVEDIEFPDQTVESYLFFLKDTLRRNITFEDIKIVIDCANGATSMIAPVLFEMLKAETIALSVDPDGENINRDCGSEHTEALRRKVLETGADAGLAFDGDGDRIIAIDEKGAVLTGDHILIICANMLKKQGELDNDIVVSTVMSNIGLSLALKRLNIEHVTTQVGDRHVLEKMIQRNAVIGGESSGHIIFLNHHISGDGLLSAIQLLSAIKVFARPLSELSGLMQLFPQAINNVPVKEKPDIATIPGLVEVIKEVEQALNKKGRVFVRYSGTEPVCRVMVEGEKMEEIVGYARRIGDVIKRHPD